MAKNLIGTVGLHVCIAAVFSLAACDGGKIADGGSGNESLACRNCHGSDQNAAPPGSLGGATETSFMGVGAHQAHLVGGTVSNGIACWECHVVPALNDLASHIDHLPAEVTFGELTRNGNLQPSWDHDSGSCSSTYCHGGTLSGGSNTEPIWNKVGEGEAACGTCHGSPPPAPHPAIANCSLCHSGTVDKDGAIILSGGLHINGTVETSQKGAECDSCHGNPPEPPHPTGTNCSICHAKTVNPDGSINDDGGHVNGKVDHTTYHDDGYFAPSAHGSDFNQQGGPDSCKECHGQDLTGGEYGGSCDACHPGFKSKCFFCHGGTDNNTGAPPASLSGDVKTTFMAVGAHSVHVAETSDWHNPVTCSACHMIYTDALDDGHIDGQAGLTWGVSATRQGAQPQWDGTAGTCASTYCHGSTLGDGSNTEPTWNKVGEGEAACGSCHGNPPAAPHPDSTNCEICHGDVVGPEGTWVAPERHMDGILDSSSPHPEGYASASQHGVDFTSQGLSACTNCHGVDLTGGSAGVSCDKCHSGFKSNCTFCHGGTDNDMGSPPESVSGNTETSQPGVGAHSTHLVKASTWHATVSCSACHKVPVDALAEGHIDGGSAEVVISKLNEDEGEEDEEAQWHKDDGTCSSTYCHGGSSSGGTSMSPQWYLVDGTQSACGSCHGIPPTEDHTNITDCSMCHGCVADGNQQIRPEGAPFHMNGEVNMESAGNCPQ
jgi:predicted CxxxxCH...CXXCH cytochrome family protein